MDRKTIFCDIDGCLIEHQDFYNEDMILIPGTLEKLKEWEREGHKLILTTGRRESSRNVTTKKLSEAGIHYDCLIMGLGPDERIIINDKKPGLEKNTAYSINLQRNKGIKEITL
jgi:hypothetical protein